jgi:TetR/AcrR family hemagglutinin/protease transcriptional regulator
MAKSIPKKSAPVRKRERLSQEERRTQLLNCAVKIFAEHGLDAANHALVAEEASVSVPTVFFYFGSREKLVDAVLTDVERVNKLNFNKALENKAPANEVLIALSFDMIDSLNDHTYHSRIFREWSIMERADIWPRFLKLHQMIINTLIKIIKRGQREGNLRAELNAEDEAYILHASSYSMAHMMLTGCSQSKIESYLRTVLGTVLLPGAFEQAKQNTQ